MTRKEIMSLTERELEIAVGREVMGYEVYHYDKGYQDYFLLWDRKRNPVFPPRLIADSVDRGERSTEAKAWDDTPRYTFNTDAFIDVLDELTRRRLTDTYERIIQENRDPRAPLLQGPVPREECLRAAIIAVTEEKSND